MSQHPIRWVLSLMIVLALSVSFGLAAGRSLAVSRQAVEQDRILPSVAAAARAIDPAQRFATDWTAPHVAGQLLIKMPEAAAASAQARFAQAGVRVLRHIPQLGLMLVEAPQPTAERGQALAQVAADLVELLGAEWAEPNYTFDLDYVPNDPFYAQTQAIYLNRLEMAGAWNYTTGQPEIIIAIMDTGVDMSHDDLRKAIWINAAEIPNNGVDDDGNGFVDDVNGWNFPDNSNRIYDDHGHGTHVAGIAAARINNAIGISGMAGSATFMPVDVFPSSGYGTYEDLIRAMIYAADNGARIINMSLGASSYSRGEEAAVDYAWSRGAVVVAAAGNSSRNSYHYPAAHPNVIAVAATDAYDNRAGFSTWGDFVDVAAPGSGIYSTFRGNRYTTMSGTSMATPHVAGLAALILSLNPQLSPDQVRGLIQQNADDLGAAGWDPYFGHGRINARKTLAAVPPPNPTPPPPPDPQPPLTDWPANCQELITDGDFETGLAAWQASGAAQVDETRAYSGTHALHFPGGPNSRGIVTRTVTLPPFPQEATLWFAYRIENADQGWGSSPQMPYDDWAFVELRTAEGRVLSSLLRTGNSADTATDGLPWDRFIYRMRFADLSALRMLPAVNLVVSAGNDADNQPTDFWLDAVRFCVTPGHGGIFPWIVVGEH